MADHPPSRRRMHRTTLIALLAAALTLLGLPFDLTATPAAATSGLTEETHARFVVTENGTVTAEVTTTIANVTPDEGSRYYYFDEYSIAVPASAAEVQATSGGSSLTVRISEDEEYPDQLWAHASFAPLRYGQSRTIEWTYTIEGAPLRSEQSTRVGPGYAMFPAQASGDEGAVSVEVVAPRSLDFNATIDFESERQGDTNVYRSEEYSDGWGVWSAVSLRDPDQAETAEVPLDGVVPLTVHSLPGDEEWRDFAVGRIATGVPVLEELLGAPWPADVQVVREDISPHVIGYAWFDSVGNEIVVGEELDEVTLYHELGHAWFNAPEFSSRWLREGLTEATAYRAVALLGGESTPPEAPDRSGDGSLPLIEWTEDHQRTETDDYGYPASYTAVQAFLGDLDNAQFSAVIAAAYDGESAYEQPGSGENHGPVDWRRFLDLAAERGGVDGTGAYRRWVVTEEQGELLDARAAARERYASIDETDGAWQPPLGLRTEMTDWDFDAAEGTFPLLEPAAEDAAAVQRAAADTGLDVPEAVRSAYEEAESEEDYAALEATLPQAATVIGQVAEVTEIVTTEGDPFTELGEALVQADRTVASAGAALTAGELDRAQTLADTASERAGWAMWLGVAFVAAALILLVLIVLGAVLLARRRRRPATGAPEPIASGPDSEMR
ncbi:hypothetical protein [Ruania alba]|uniref:Peptidase family M1 n=1 Tax=Ruania alba TaxID=648782 RepID=A0A1H5MZJ8_9MICO|nr:hypothetical protein [Ruania alba]SEE94772.1 hypothetical protein SAMN04488554_3791 [Ruania alba]